MSKAKTSPKKADEHLRWLVAATLLGVGYYVWRNERSNAHESIGAAPPPRDASVRHQAMLAHLHRRISAMETARAALPPGTERLTAWRKYAARHPRWPAQPQPTRGR